MKKIMRVGLVVLVSFMSLSACTHTSSENTVSESVSPSSVPSVSVREKSSENNRFASVLTSADLPDPRTMTGISEVDDLPDPSVVEGEFVQQLPVDIEDAKKNRVHIDSTKRVMALDVSGTLSRTVIALGFADYLVGRTVSSTEKILEKLPVVTENGHQLNAESILSLKPDLIFTDGSVGPVEVLDQVKNSGVKVVYVSSQHSAEQVTEVTSMIAGALGVPDAGKALNEKIVKDIADVQKTIDQWAPEKPLDISFLYVRGTAGIFFILGKDDGAGNLISLLKGNDIAGEKGINGTTPANSESLVAMNPDVFFVMKNGLESTGGKAGFLARSGVSQTKAGKNERIISIPDGIALSFGPQTADILYNIAKALYGVKE